MFKSNFLSRMYLIIKHFDQFPPFKFAHQRGALRWGEAVRLASGITNGVAYLHSERSQSEWKVPIAHRDLKSTNVLVRTDGTCVISDFGLAMSLDSIEDASKNVSACCKSFSSD